MSENGKILPRSRVKRLEVRALISILGRKTIQLFTGFSLQFTGLII